MWSEEMGRRPLFEVPDGAPAGSWADDGGRTGPSGAIQPDQPPDHCEDARRLDYAVNDLKRRFPRFSAASLGGAGSLVWASAIAALLAGIAEVAPGWALIVLLSLPFFFVVQIRLAALGIWLTRNPLTVAPSPLAGSDAPAYSVLVPLYREPDAVPGLVEALARLDYPKAKLQILFITEVDDDGTRQALRSAIGRLNDPPEMSILTVPDGLPRTKPRALNFALQAARGDIVAIFDAEDEPDVLQLRAAAAAFASGGPRLACVQAPLQIYNPEETAFTRQFALEYAALFDAVLPALWRMGLPLPLGGTSNHFRRDVLIQCGAWDPFNVTEDADLGFRLARFGYDVALISPATWEEAPPRATGWFHQRTRWLKGWMQTYLVHMRSPTRLWADFGPWRFLGFQAILAGMILSALVHPWFYVFLAADAWSGASLPEGPGHERGAERMVWWLSLGNLALSYVVSILLSALALRRRGARPRLLTLIALPFYWLAISAAAYRAVYELIVSPFHWAKTEHRGISCAARRAAVGASVRE